MSQPIIKALQNLHSDNFVAYFNAHVYHFNVQGSAFAQDHSLLQEVYEYLWEAHDFIGEQIRQMGVLVNSSLADISDITIINSAKQTTESKDMFAAVSGDINTLIESAQSLYTKTTDYGGLQTLLGDYMKALSKLNWKVKAQINRSVNNG